MCVVVGVYATPSHSLTYSNKHHVRTQSVKTAKIETPLRTLNNSELDLNEKAFTHYQTYLQSDFLEDVNDSSAYEAIREYITQHHNDIRDKDAEEISKEIVEQGRLYQIDPKFAAAVISAESGFNKEAISKSGAKGLGQLMDSTYADFGIQNPYNIQENVRGTVLYLKDLISLWNGHSLQLSLAITSYLRGPVLVKKAEGKFSDHTLQYLGLILKKYNTLCAIESKIQKKHTNESDKDAVTSLN